MTRPVPRSPVWRSVHAEEFQIVTGLLALLRGQFRLLARTMHARQRIQGIDVRLLRRGELPAVIRCQRLPFCCRTTGLARHIPCGSNHQRQWEVGGPASTRPTVRTSEGATSQRAGPHESNGRGLPRINRTSAGATRPHPRRQASAPYCNQVRCQGGPSGTTGARGRDSKALF